jgi:hypothetical protein
LDLLSNEPLMLEHGLEKPHLLQHPPPNTGHSHSRPPEHSGA